MTKDIIGIDISDFSLEAVLLDKARGHFVVKAYSRYRLSPEIVEDGKIIDAEQLKDALKNLLAKAKPKAIKSKKVFLSIPESRVFTNVFSLPKNLSKKELQSAANYKAEEMVPEAAENLIGDMKVLSANNGFRDVLYAAAEKETVINLIKIFEDLKMEIVGITTEAISSFAGLDDKLKKKTTLLLDIGARTTIASVFDNNSIRNTININIAGDNITRAIKEKLSISYSEAEKKKCEFGLTPSKKDGQIMLIIQGQLQPLTDEIKKFIYYYETSAKQKIEQVVLVGGSARIKGIDKYFSENLDRPALVGKSFAEGSSLIKSADSTKYINAIGLARLSQQKADIDFYTAKQIRKAEKKPDREGGSFIKKMGSLKIFKFFRAGNASDAKKIFKNIYIMIAFFVIVLGIAGFYFEDNIRSIFESNSYSFSKNITVGLEYSDGLENFVPASKVEVFESGDDIFAGLPYHDAVNALHDNLSEIAMNDLDVRQDTRYIVPEIFSEDVIDISPLEEDFNVGDSVSMDITFNFLSISESYVRQLVLSDLNLDMVQKVSTWPIAKNSYTIINHDKDKGIFELQAFLEFQRP